MSAPHALPARTLVVSGLACRRGERLLFEGLDFTVGPGEILLLRGPNGAGKSSLLLLLADLLRPEAGDVILQGVEAHERQRTDLHFLGHLSAVKPRLTLAENLRFWSDLNGGSRSLVAPALDATGLTGLADLAAGHLSAGQSRRLGLARLLSADRPVWLLDEPTTSLDNEGEQLVGVLIDAHLRRGGLVVAATHHDLALHGQALQRSLTLGTAP